MKPIPKPKVKAPPPSSPTTKSKKQFKIEPWTGDKEGEKIILYAVSKMGKTTLSALAPDPVFIGVDDGGRKIKHPITGKDLNRIPDINNFQDIRDAINWFAISKNGKTLVIDTITETEQWSLPHMFKTISGPKGMTVTNLEGYGYNKGYQHLYETMRLILSDCDKVIKAGKNVIMVAQGWPSKYTHPEAEDFLKDGPQLSTRTPSNLAQFVAWADHILRIDYQHVQVENKKATGTTERVICVKPEVWFIAGSRTIPPEYDVVSFENPQDNSIWKLIFGDY